MRPAFPWKQSASVRLFYATWELLDLMAEHDHELFDFPLAQQALLIGLHPGPPLTFVSRAQPARQRPEMLTSVVKIHNVNRAGKVQGGQILNPFGSGAC